jgi:hypothetical protein
MATKDTLYGRLTVVLKNNVQIDNLISTGLKQATGTRNVTTKDSNDMDESRPTIKSQTVDFKFYASNVSTANFEALQTSRDNKTIEVWKYSTGVSGSKYWSASGFITALDYDAAHDGTLEGTGTVQLTGDVTFGTV